MSHSTSLSSLSGALSSLRTSTYTLSSTLSILDAGIADLPRLSHVLTQTRHFELLPLSTLQSAQEEVVAELAPEVERLISRVEGYVERLEARERGLKARAELQEGRLEGGVARGGQSMGMSRMGSLGATGSGRGKERAVAPVGAREELKARQLRQKKERLSYAVDRLQLQAQQTEKKLRKSLAAQELRRGVVDDDEEEDELA